VSVGGDGVEAGSGGHLGERRRLEFGWFLPTAGDATTLGDRGGLIPASLELFDRVITAARAAGFEYLLVPVNTDCWEAWITAAMMIGRSRSIRMLVARAGYIAPFLVAKMVATFDQLSNGRISVNLIAGQSEAESSAEGIRAGKEERYERMAEEVRILKTLWTAPGRVDFAGTFHELSGARLVPRPRQQPHPRSYLGGGSAQAWAISAEHADVHLFWGDTYERIETNIAALRALADEYGRGDDIRFGMRLQIVCRETEDAAWDAARALVANVTERHTDRLRAHVASSVANARVQELATTYGDTIEDNLWTGISRVRPGAGIAVVGDPQQCAGVLQRYIDLGCDSFCLSGYLHDEEATRFAQMVRPIIVRHNPGRLAEAPSARIEPRVRLAACSFRHSRRRDVTMVLVAAARP
jgi:alkanesulfonate monooxygenase